MSSISLPNPFPTSNNLCTFQKGSGVSLADTQGCEITCYEPDVALSKLQDAFPALDDETVWTSQAAIVSSCDEMIFGPVDQTPRQFVHNLKATFCLPDNLVLGIVNSILNNPVLNYRARFIEAQRQVEAVKRRNQNLLTSYAAAAAAANASSLDTCQVIESVRAAISSIPKDTDEGRQIRCCLASCLSTLCQPSAQVAPAPQLEELPCPCPPISCEALANACVVIKVQSSSTCNPAAADVTCDDTISCNSCDNAAAGSYVTMAGLDYGANCLLPTGAEYDPQIGSDPIVSDRAVVLTFRAGRNCVTGTGVTEDDGFPAVPPTGI